MSRKLRCPPRLPRPRPPRKEAPQLRQTSPCPSPSRYGEPSGLMFFFFDPRVKCKTASGRGAPFCALPGKRKNNTKKFCAPPFPERRPKASGSPQNGRRFVSPLPPPELRRSNAPGPPCPAAKRPRIIMLWSKSIPDPSCGQCSGLRDGPRPWPE